jgi:hypothetical protein
MGSSTTVVPHLLVKILSRLDEEEQQAVTARQLRSYLDEEGWSCTDEEWKSSRRAFVKREAEKIINGEEEMLPKVKPNKYDRRAQKNLTVRVFFPFVGSL